MREAQHTQETATSTTARTRKPRAKKQPQFTGDAPALPIAAKEPGQFGRVAITNVTPASEDGAFMPRVELGEPFTVTARVFMEGTGHVGATGVLKGQRGRIMARKPMTLTNTDLESYAVTLQAGEHTDVAPWDESFAETAKQLGNWKFAVEGWADTFADWLQRADEEPASDAIAKDRTSLAAHSPLSL